MPDPDYFLQSREWRVIRMRCLERDGARCACCGRTAADGIVINVDHIKPRARYPELALDVNNLQVLCNECNHGKGNQFETDWRRPTTAPTQVKRDVWLPWLLGGGDQAIAECVARAVGYVNAEADRVTALRAMWNVQADSPFMSQLRTSLQHTYELHKSGVGGEFVMLWRQVATMEQREAVAAILLAASQGVRGA